MFNQLMLMLIAIGFVGVSLGLAYSFFVGARIARQQELTYLQMDVALFNAEHAGEEDDNNDSN